MASRSRFASSGGGAILAGGGGGGGGGKVPAAALAGLGSGLDGSVLSTWGFLFPLTTLPTVDVVPDLAFVVVVLVRLSSRRSLDSVSLLDVLPPSLLLRVWTEWLIELRRRTLRRGGAAVGSWGCVLGGWDCDGGGCNE